jgi:hypothetical protein
MVKSDFTGHRALENVGAANTHGQFHKVLGARPAGEVRFGKRDNVVREECFGYMLKLRESVRGA